MPRDGSGNYTLPYPAVVDGTTIESAVHNGTMSDIALQLNGPLPIIAGGTGANNADTALSNLKGEKALQYVTNYDSHVFVSGSFYSTGGATGEPPGGGAQTGVCVVYGDPNFITITARAVADGNNPGKSYVRQKVSGVWAAWVEQPSGVADLDARYVNLTGDTMTGGLSVPSLSVPGVSGSINVGQDIGFGMSVPAGANLYFTSGSYRLSYVAGSGFQFVGAPLIISDGTPSFSPTTGALTVAGGVGVGEKLSVAGIVTGNMFSVTGADGGTTNGMYRGYSGTRLVNIGGTDGWQINNFENTTVNLHVSNAGVVNIPATTASTSSTTGALTVAGGVGVGGAVCAVNLRAFNGSYVEFNNPTNTGQFKMAYSVADLNLRWNFNDGASIMTLNNVGDLALASTTAASSYATGALTVAGGVGVAKDIWCTGNIVAYRSTAAVAKIHTANSVRSWSVSTDAAGNFNITDESGSVVRTSINTSGVWSFGQTVVIGTQIQNSASPNAALRIGYGGGGTMYGITLRPAADNTVAMLFANVADGTSGSINTTASTTTFNTASDGRLKEDLKSFDAGNVVDNTAVYDFAWKTTGERSYGVIAQQAMDVYPAAVTYLEEQDWYGIDYSKYVPVLLQELKALRARVAALEGGATIGTQPAKKK